MTNPSASPPNPCECAYSGCYESACIGSLYCIECLHNLSHTAPPEALDWFYDEVADLSRRPWLNEDLNDAR